MPAPGHTQSTPWSHAFPPPSIEKLIDYVQKQWRDYVAEFVNKGSPLSGRPEPALTKALSVKLNDNFATQESGIRAYFVPENHLYDLAPDGSAKLRGRSDITCYWASLVFTIEFKKLDGKKSSRRAYCGTNGIGRFVSAKYARNESRGAMCGILGPSAASDPNLLANSIECTHIDLHCIPFPSTCIVQVPSEFTHASFDTRHSRPSPPAATEEITLTHFFLHF